MGTPAKIPARVASMVEHARDLRSFILEPERAVPQFRPGQFLHLALDSYDPTGHWPESRVFSIASSPTARHRLRITVSRKGIFTHRMFETLDVASQVWIKLPYGTFDPTPPPNGAGVYLAGGTGITPFVGFLEWAAETRNDQEMHVHYGARECNLLVYRTLLEQYQKHLPGLTVTYYAEGPVSGPVKSGRIVTQQVWTQLNAPQHARFFVSGPKDMVRSHCRGLHDLGAATDAIVVDKWD